MKWRRTAFSAILLLSIILTGLSVAQLDVSGQGYVTVTTRTTAAATYTYAAATSYEKVTTSSYVSYVNWGSMANGPMNFTIQVCGKGAYDYWTWNAVQGQLFHIEWGNQENVPLDFYITPTFPAVNSVDCSQTPDVFAKVYYYHAGVSGSVDWVAPSNGQYIAWVFNMQPAPPQSVSGTFSIETVATTMAPSVFYVTGTTNQLLMLTTTSSMSLAGLPNNHLEIFGVIFGVIVAIVAVAGFLVFARRKKPPSYYADQGQRETASQEPPKADVPFESHPQTEIALSPPVASKVSETRSVAKESESESMSRPRPIAATTLKIPVIPPKPLPATQSIISTGYEDLDKVLEGGIPQGFAVVIASPSYDERDLLLRKVIESTIANDGTAFYISNDVSKTQDFSSRFQSGLFVFSTQISPGRPNVYKIPGIENLSEVNISLGIALRGAKGRVKGTGPLVILLDILSDLLLKYKAMMTRRWLSDFVTKRKGEGFTIIATLNPLVASKEEAESVLDFFDGVIEIHERTITERARRFLTVKKMYGRRYSENELMLDRDKLL